MKVVISGYYGFNNTGDEAVLSSIISRLRGSNKDTDITVLSADPADTSAKYKVRSVHRMSLPSMIRSISACDILISGGGTLFQDATGKLSPLYYLSVIWIARLLGKKFVILGQGYGPVRGKINRALIRCTLNSASLITLRDQRSYKDMLKEGITKPPVIVCADPAFLLESGNKTGESKQKPKLGICIRPPVNSNPDFRKNLASALDQIIEKFNMEAVFIPFQPPVDTEESAKVALLMKNKVEILTGGSSPQDILNLICGLDVLIGMRLHSLIFAVSSAVPVIGIDYDPKVSSMMEEAGCPLLKQDLSAEELTSAFGSVWLSRNGIRIKLAERSKYFREKAGLNFTSFYEYAGPLKEITILGIKINNVSMAAATAKADEFIKSGEPHIIFTPNPEIILAAQKDGELKRIINSADLGIPDGIGIIAAAKILGTPLAGRVAGIDLMVNLLSLARKNGYKVFLLGSAPGVAEDATRNLTGINVAGTNDGYFKESEERIVIDKIKASKPDILFVGLGSPRQEKWLYKHYKELGAPVSMVIGGSLDVISGRKKRAPELFQKLNIEWLYRLTQEPMRWRRQIKLIEFVWLAIKHKLMIK